MSWWSRILGIENAAQVVLPDPYEPFMSTRGIPVMDPGTPLEMYHRAQVDQLWKTQPTVRKVVDFIARSVASIPLHTFERVGDTERVRITGHPLSTALSEPRPGVGSFRFWHSVLSDALLYDRWAVLIVTAGDGRVELVQIPSWRLALGTDAFRQVERVRVWMGDIRSVGQTDKEWEDIPLGEVILDHGYAPSSAGLSPLETLSPILQESAEAIRHRQKVWENSARVPAYVKRPIEAVWSNEQRTRFVNSLRKYRADGESAGGWPLLEDGMEIAELSAFSSSDSMDLQGRELNAVEVASAFHVAPEMVGIRPGNYSNQREFRQSLYRDSLGPYITAWEQAINVQLVPRLADGRALYVEAHLESKLRGSFEEQAQIAQASVGAPTMTRNEYRARMNMPPLEGGDDIVTPLNVLIGGQASPRDSGSQNRRSSNRRRATKSLPERDGLAQVHQREIGKFFKRQAAAVLSRMGAKDAGWWNQERWDDELQDVLLGLHAMAATAAGRASLDSLGVDPEEWDEPRTMSFLRESARRSAEGINLATFDALTEAVADPDLDPAHVFEVAEESRSVDIASTTLAFAAGFGAVEAARQQAPQATKTWRTTSTNPRASHAAMDGETVSLDEDFSNGLPWPGAAGSDADEVAGCQCEVDLNIP